MAAAAPAGPALSGTGPDLTEHESEYEEMDIDGVKVRVKTTYHMPGPKEFENDVLDDNCRAEGFIEELPEDAGHVDPSYEFLFNVCKGEFGIRSSALSDDQIERLHDQALAFARASPEANTSRHRNDPIDTSKTLRFVEGEEASQFLAEQFKSSAKYGQYIRMVKQTLLIKEKRTDDLFPLVMARAILQLEDGKNVEELGLEKAFIARLIE